MSQFQSSAQQKAPVDQQALCFNRVFTSQTLQQPAEVVDLIVRELAHDELKLAVYGCHACSESKLTKPLPLKNFGSRIMIVGEKPDDVLWESEQGAALLKCLQYYRFDLDKLYFTSAIKCKESSSFEVCQQHLIREFMQLRPIITICLGYYASTRFSNRPTLGNYDEIFPNQWVLTTYSFKDALSDESMSTTNTLYQQFAHISNQMQQELKQSERLQNQASI